MKTKICGSWPALRALWRICVVIGFFHAGFSELLFAADAPGNLQKLRCLYPRDKPLILESEANAFATFRDGSKVVLANGDAAELWDLTTGEKTLSLKHPDVVIGVALSPDEKTLLTIMVGRESPVRLWSLRDEKLLKEYPSPFRNIIPKSKIDKYKRDGWHWHYPGDLPLSFGSNIFLPQEVLGFTSVVFSPTGKYFATGSEKGDIILWSMKTGTKVALLAGKAKRSLNLKFSPDETKLLSHSWDGTISLWDTKNKSLIKQFKDEKQAHQNFAYLIFSSDGKQVVIRNPKNQAIFDTKTGKEAQLLPKLTKMNECFAMLADDQKILCASRSSLDVYDIPTGRLIKQHADRHYMGYPIYLPDVAAVMVFTVDNSENTMHETWTKISIIPLSEFKEAAQEKQKKE